MANLNSVGTPDVNKRVASEHASRQKPRRQTTSLRERQGKVPPRYSTGGRPQAPRQAPRQVAQPQAPVRPTYQQATPTYPQPVQPSPDRTQAGWATNTALRPARPDLGQTPMAPPPRPQNVNYVGPQAPVQGGFTGGRPMVPRPMPVQNQYAATQPYRPPTGYTGNMQPMPQRMAPRPMQMQPGAWRQPQRPSPWANQYNPMNRWRR